MKKQNVFASQQIVVAVLIGAVLLLTGLYLLVLCSQQYKQAADVANTSVLRDLILQAARGSKTDAIVEARTGDVYFPKAKLYVPSNPDLSDLAYDYDSDGANGPELTVSSKSIFERSAVKLYNAKTNDELFARVPKLQACQRGILFVYQQLSNDDKRYDLQQSSDVGGGKTLYAYTEKACPELIETADTLKNIKSYE